MIDQVTLYKSQAINNDPTQINLINQSTNFTEEIEDLKFGSTKKSTHKGMRVSKHHQHSSLNHSNSFDDE
jgi:hypothetical protein